VPNNFGFCACAGTQVSFRLMFRRGMYDLYLEDALIQSLSLPVGGVPYALQQELRLVGSWADATELRSWGMNLTDESPSPHAAAGAASTPPAGAAGGGRGGAAAAVAASASPQNNRHNRPPLSVHESPRRVNSAVPCPFNCSYAGECQPDGSCRCDAPFTGAACQQLDQLPGAADAPAFKAPRGSTTWGGSPMQSDDGNRSEYFLFASLTRNSTIYGYAHSSVIVTATSSNPGE
jgi:hypothetical protein